MDKEEIVSKRLKELAELITKHNYNYHTLDRPKITDQEFDKLVKENDALEKKYPDLILKDSPNKNYGSIIKDNFKKIKHNSQMYSLANAFDNSDIKEFIKRSVKYLNLDNKKYIAALNRFKIVVNEFSMTKFTPEALHRMVEAYYEMGMYEDSYNTAALLGYNYPDTKWYEYSYNLVKQIDNEETFLKKIRNFF